MTRLYWIVIPVLLFIFLQTGYLWAVRPLSEGAATKPHQIEGKKEPVSRTGFEHTEEPAPPEVIKAIEMERELKREVIQRKREREEETGEEFEKVTIEETPIEKLTIEELPAKQPITSPGPVSAGYSRLFIILVIPLILIALGLAYHIYRRKG